MEHIVRFPSRDKALFGVLHEPTASPVPVGVVFLNAGPQNRVGPQRIYLRAARRFADAGVTCLRVDLPGVGESQGSAFDGTPDSHDPAYVRGAIDLLVRRGVGSVVLLGLCAGARAAVRAARLDRRVGAVVCWSVPIVSGASEFDGFSPAATRALLRHWARRVLQPWRWMPQLASLRRLTETSGRIRAALSAARSSHVGDDASAFTDEIRGLAAGGRALLFAFGQRDIGALAEFEQHLASVLDQAHADSRVVLVPDGDHTFSSIAARDRVIEETIAWLARLPDARRDHSQPPVSRNGRSS
jgi:pimeloyl-ACP methyl ester carboxylesterase